MTIENIDKTNFPYSKNKLLDSVRSIYDILEDINFVYQKDWIYMEHQDITLAYCSFDINKNRAVVYDFYTANATGFKNWDFKKLSNLDILREPIKDLWKKLFEKMIEEFKKHWASQIYLIYRKDTNSLEFYKKMKDYFPDKISSISEPMSWTLSIKLI